MVYTFDTTYHLKVRAGDIYHPKCLIMDGQNYVGMGKLMEEICNQQCIVCSFGIGLGWYFQDEISAFGCKVYTYDPAISHGVRRSENIRYEIGAAVESTKDGSGIFWAICRMITGRRTHIPST
jgi:hypothetical protein